MPTTVPFRAIAFAAVLGGLALAVPEGGSACCHGGGGGGGGGIQPTPPAVMPPVLVPGAPPGVGEAVTKAVRDAVPPAERPPEMRPLDPAEVERIEAERAAAEEARHRQAERDIDYWQDWLDTGKEAKVAVGWVNNVAGGVALTACLTGVGCIPVAIYVAGKVIEVVSVSHAEASHGTDIVGRLVNGSAAPEERWRRIRINGFGTLGSELIGVAVPGDLAVTGAGGGAILQESMGQAANEAYEGVRDHINERNAQLAREREERRRVEFFAHGYLEDAGISISGGFPLPAAGYPGR